jgi:hypothetical protein
MIGVKIPTTGMRTTVCAEAKISCCCFLAASIGLADPKHVSTSSVGGKEM